jgi:hypothetical protein
MLIYKNRLPKMSDEHYCKKCKKQYKDRTGLWKHNRNFHSTNNSNSLTLPSSTPPQNTEYQCEFCNKILSRQDNLKRHMKNCKKANDTKNSDKEEIMLLKTIINNMSISQKKIEKMEKELNELKNTNNNNNNVNKNKNINNGNIYNGKVINNITINAPGHEMITLTKDDIENLCKSNLMSVLKYVEKTNFDKEKKYNHNFCTTNQNGKYLLHYDQETSSIKSAKKKYFYQEVIVNAINKIESSYNNHKNEFSKSKQKYIEDIIIRLKDVKDYDFNNKILKSLFDELNLLCYNSRDIVLDTWQYYDVSCVGIDESCKDIFIPVQEYLEIYNNEIENNKDEDDNSTTPHQLIIKKQNKKSYSDSDSDNNIDL